MLFIKYCIQGRRKIINKFLQKFKQYLFLFDEPVKHDFTKDYSKEIFEASGINHDPMNVFYTTSYKGVIRALHFRREKQQANLVRLYLWTCL